MDRLHPLDIELVVALSVHAAVLFLDLAALSALVCSIPPIFPCLIVQSGDVEATQ